MFHKKIIRLFALFIFGAFCPSASLAQNKAYFVDGFHGGVWGHYPEGYTAYIMSELNKYPDWKINLEIEPETWEREKKVAPEAYEAFRKMFLATGTSSRIEYVNPTYGQSYFFNTLGESIIRQFYYGIREMKNHFPNAVYTTYSSEEPCFTSALPQLLNSFGFKYASLKNPNTCWGGYTRAHGGELVYWTGPDGSQLLTVPRYEFEKLKPGSTWETIGNANSLEFVKTAFNYGIKAPLGMCLQDAGWKQGPWLRGGQYMPSEYTTWINYFENIVDKNSAIPQWKLTQEDVQVGLVWGSQVLQKIAQEVRASENNIIQAEKIAVMQNLQNSVLYPTAILDEAWKQLLLSQHHDCWIVPYNGKKGDTWADKVTVWTNYVNRVSSNIITESNNGLFVKVYNTTGYNRKDEVLVNLPVDFDKRIESVTDGESSYGATVLTIEGKHYLRFIADVPAFGYKTFKMQELSLSEKKQISYKDYKNKLVVDTPLYTIQFDKEKGGSIVSLIGKTLENKEFVAPDLKQQFGGLQGNFYNNGGKLSTFNHPVDVVVKRLGNDALEIVLTSVLAGAKVVRTVKISAENPKIDFNLKIYWTENIGIGAGGNERYKSNPVLKAFYNDREKLTALFPLNLKGQRVFKNAPFDVLESKLGDTFFDSWDNIKNNIIVNWVDVTDRDGKYGCALFSDHTTSYAHASDFPLGLTVQYSGTGLWGANYPVKELTDINYSILPHKGMWQQADIWNKNRRSEEPLQATLTNTENLNSRSFISFSNSGWDIAATEMRDGGIFLRVFNAGPNLEEGTITFDFDPGKVSLMALNDTSIKEFEVIHSNTKWHVKLGIPQFGVRTLRLKTEKK